MFEKQQVHRPGALKQTNKLHKHGRHRSKGSISIASKGKISIKNATKKNKKSLNKEQRRLMSSQLRQKKRNEIMDLKRKKEYFDIAPTLVCLLPLNKEHDPKTILNLLCQCDKEAIVNDSSQGVTRIYIPRFKQRFEILIPCIQDELAILDAVKVCDSVVFLLSAINEESIDVWGENILSTILAQGLPTPNIALTDLESVPIKKRNIFKQQIQKNISRWFPDEKLLTVDKEVEGINLLRKLADQKQKTIHFRNKRPYLLAEEVEYIPDKEGLVGTLKLTGYLRGTPLSISRLVHLPGLGTYQITQIEGPPDPFPSDKERKTDEGIKIYQKYDPSDAQTLLKPPDLVSENIPDLMDSEQTWPTKEEIENAEEEHKKLKKIKRIPKGWSDYQASWIPDEDADFEFSSDSEDESQNESIEAMSDEKSVNNDDEALDANDTESEIEADNEKYDREIDMEAEQLSLNQLKEAKSDRNFPDEIDTPLNEAARVRFQKYRGLESFRTSPWDPKENLPSDYARIFQFENFDRTRKRIIHDVLAVDGVLSGWYMSVYVTGVSQNDWANFTKSDTKPTVTLFGLYPDEQKMSVINVVLKRTQNSKLPIKSKDKLIFQCGFRRFSVRPVFSQHTNGNKHKFERYFQPDSTVVATFYAPIQFPPAPVLCYRQVGNRLVLVATGNLLSCNPDRIVLKRIVLSGHPFKILKRSAVIRFMFFNREDIIYFKPVKLRTKMGRSGHIKEPLGTHGHMKCVFDGQLKSQDTVLLNLYKRVFPKWSYENIISTQNPINTDDSSTNNQMEM